MAFTMQNSTIEEQPNIIRILVAPELNQTFHCSSVIELSNGAQPLIGRSLGWKIAKQVN